ncbi:hypothetical protein NMB0518 [Neisseria meningitidis MC58]|uniref:Uncharacterized protein n=1 Tax=Neisseria meningitidis serogroup B (strain ATCC BAA-335 / MC58) TaxID=122586 RepID=Q9K0R2_NEIMB|nr:hypothetical protein NMB0518 [Neisseria meningitidis MC58]MBG8625823.1 hypothetical protein [Neisseria meningitidis]
MKIFWRIFMRQISLTDYFCKGLRFKHIAFRWFAYSLCHFQCSKYTCSAKRKKTYRKTYFRSSCSGQSNSTICIKGGTRRKCYH